MILFFMFVHSDPTFSLLLGFGGGLWSFYLGLRKFREYKLVSDMPDLSVRSLAMGMVRTRGTAIVESPVSSPITHTSCCGYKVEIERWKSGDRDRSDGWTKIATDIDGPAVYLQGKGGGKVLVDIVHAEWELPRITQLEVNSAATGANLEYLQYVQRAETRSMARKVQGFVHNRLGANDEKAKGVDSLFGAFDSAVKGDRTALFKLMMQRMEMSGPLNDPMKEQRRQEALSHFRGIIGQATSLGVAVDGGPNEVLPKESFPAGQLDDQLPQIPVFKPPVASGHFRLSEYCIMPGVEYGVTGTCMENPDATGVTDRNFISQGREEHTLLISSSPDNVLDHSLRNTAFKMIAGGALVSTVCLLFLLMRL